MPERSHLSIGEVLSLLREEFPDVTISKIRFLESQGLVDPERTPSGYRKFYDQDVERLRWILRQQREHFLPLKVIRGRLSEGGGEEHNGTGLHTSTTSTPDRGETAEAAHLPGLAPPGTPPGAPPAPPAGSPLGPREQTSRTDVLSRQPTRESEETARATGEPERRGQAEPLTERAEPAPASRAETAPRAGVRRPETAAEARGMASAPQPEPKSPSPATRRAARGGDREVESYSAEELASAAGAPADLVNELKQYGLITVHTVVAGTPYFDETALAITQAAVGFARHGVEARHLRAWRNSADREAALFEQLIMPLLRQR
ncbi:MAG TPA: MerR family transcriptional regulator, partial [Acidimicrobiales bacterium]|nr:MerR family transcriptional regulator [Acidimicrobiales bacterium]